MSLQKKYTISQKTKERCKIFRVSNPKILFPIDLEEIELLKLEYEKISFPIYLYLSFSSQAVEYITPHNATAEHLDDLIRAKEKTIEVIPAIKNSDCKDFKILVDRIKLKKAAGKSYTKLDSQTVQAYTTLSCMSQMISEGFSSKSLKQVEEVINEIVEGALLQKKGLLCTLNKIIALDPTLYDHSTMVAMICGLIANKINFSGLDQKEIVKQVVKCGFFHDIGKLKISPDILNKPTKLEDWEFDEIKKHPEYGKRISQESGLSLVESVVAFQHHERFLGGGYPNGKFGRFESDKINGIHVYARICAIADVYSALLSKRTYKQAYNPKETIEIMSEKMVGHFDPRLYRLFLKLLLDSLDEQETEENSIDYRKFLKDQLLNIVA